MKLVQHYKTRKIYEIPEFSVLDCWDLLLILPGMFEILLASESLPIALHPLLILRLLLPVHLLQHHLARWCGVAVESHHHYHH